MKYQNSVHSVIEPGGAASGWVHGCEFTDTRPIRKISFPFDERAVTILSL